jgi:hypothetical protein
MNSVKWTAVIITGALSLTAGCASQPVYTVSDAAVIASKQSVTLDEVSKAIVRAGAGLGWQMNETEPGHIVGTLNLRNHTAVVDVTYDIKSYRVLGQHNLQYDGTNIHRNYNGWIQRLDQAIRAELTAI